MNFLRLTKGQSKNSEGLWLLRLAIWSEGSERESLHVVSGQPFAQVFRKGQDSQPGSFEPIPEGVYTVTGPFFASGVAGDYSQAWSDALGPVVFDIANLHPEQTRRGELRIHSDWNEGTSPGSAGCVTIQGEAGQHDLTRMKQFVTWFHHYKLNGCKLFVDWSLGTAPALGQEEIEK